MSITLTPKWKSPWNPSNITDNIIPRGLRGRWEAGVSRPANEEKNHSSEQRSERANNINNNGYNIDAQMEHCGS